MSPDFSFLRDDRQISTAVLRATDFSLLVKPSEIEPTLTSIKNTLHSMLIAEKLSESFENIDFEGIINNILRLHIPLEMGAIFSFRPRYDDKNGHLFSINLRKNKDGDGLVDYFTCTFLHVPALSYVEVDVKLHNIAGERIMYRMSINDITDLFFHFKNLVSFYTGRRGDPLNRALEKLMKEIVKENTVESKN
jgi:hypothetical protein